MKGSIGTPTRILQGPKHRPLTKRERKIIAVRRLGPQAPYSGFKIAPYCEDCNHKTANHGPQRCAVGSCQCRNLFS